MLLKERLGLPLGVGGAAGAAQGEDAFRRALREEHSCGKAGGKVVEEGEGEVGLAVFEGGVGCA